MRTDKLSKTLDQFIFGILTLVKLALQLFRFGLCIKQWAKANTLVCGGRGGGDNLGKVVFFQLYRNRHANLIETTHYV